MHLDMQILVGAGEMANKIEFNGEEVEIPSFGVYLFEQAKKEAYNKALDDGIAKIEEMLSRVFNDEDDYYLGIENGYQDCIRELEQLKEQK